MPISLFIEHHGNDCAFYINGDLQFYTADEAIYHEYLVIPAISLAVQRFPQTQLRVLICGGGDGLAARDVLRFPEVNHIDLVDYNPDVLELARTVFKPFNRGSLESELIAVYTQEAFDFVSKIPDNSYHVVICDFTYPTTQEETSIYSREWFQQINRILVPSGIMNTNGVSPDLNTAGFWCLYQTVLSAGLKVKPLQLDIPSFQEHDYGFWGFLFASPVGITRSELESIALPENLQVLKSEQLLQSFIFPEKLAKIRYDVTIHTLNSPQLFYYLLNHTLESPEGDDTTTTIDFLDIEEASTGILAPQNLLKLESMAQLWVEQIYQSPDSLDNHSDATKLLPVQHRYHSPRMTKEWLANLQQLLAEIDLPRLLNSLLERSQELPPQIARELRQLSENLRTGKPLPTLPPKVAEFVMILSVTLLMTNLVTPDTVFAKGSYSGGSTTYVSGDGDYVSDDAWWNKFWGVMFTSIGILWLVNIFNRPRDD